MTAWTATVRRNTALRIGGASCERLLRGLVVVPILGRLLGPRAYGKYGAAIAFVALFRPLIVGLLPVLTAEIVRRPEGELGLLRGTTRAAIRAALIAWPLCVALAHAVYRDLELTVAVACAGAVLVSDGFSLRAASWTARMRDGRIVAINVVGLVVFLAGIECCLVTRARLVVIVAAWSAAEIVQVALLQLFISRQRRPVAGIAARSLFGSSIPAILVALSSAACGNIDIVLVTRIVAPVEAGAYVAVFRLLSVSWLVPAALAQALIPVMARTEAEARRACLQAATWLMILALPLVAFSPLYARVTLLVFGGDYSGAVPLVPYCAARLAGAFAATPLRTFLIARDRQREALIGELIMLAVVVAGCLFAVPRFGIIGAAVAAAVGELLRLVYLLAAMGGAFSRALAARVARPLVECAGAAALGCATPAGWAMRTAVACACYVTLRAWSLR